jgi:hypothetical protein
MRKSLPESEPTFVTRPPVSPPGPLPDQLDEATPTRLVRLLVVLRVNPGPCPAGPSSLPLHPLRSAPLAA